MPHHEVVGLNSDRKVGQQVASLHKYNQLSHNYDEAFAALTKAKDGGTPQEIAEAQRRFTEAETALNNFTTGGSSPIESPAMIALEGKPSGPSWSNKGNNIKPGPILREKIVADDNTAIIGANTDTAIS